MKPSEMKLFEAAKLGRMELKSRIFMGPMVTNYATPEGYVSDQMKNYYEARAKGGAALVMIEAASIDFTRNKCYIRQLSVDNDKCIPGLTDLVNVLHKHGAKISLQLHHGGSTSRGDFTPLPPVSASAVSSKDAYISYSARKDLPVELPTADIPVTVGYFAKAAGRAKEAGFDGVEIHAAHAYLIGQFLSAARNKRTDGYGGDLKGRARFLLETIAAVRDVVGMDYPVWCKLTGEETGLPNGITIDETKELVRILDKDGKLIAIHVSGIPPVRTFYTPPGYFLGFAAELKKVTKLPVIVAGAISPDMAEKTLLDNKADFIAFARFFLADPDWVTKLSSGRTAEIRPCVRDSSCRDCLAYKDTPVTCTVNAAVGKEAEYAIQPAKQSKKIVVVGGGPAGLEAARVAAERGHKVTLFEKEALLGGQLLLAVKPPNKELLGDLKNYLASQARKSGVKIINAGADVAAVKKIKPDAVVIATGSNPVTLRIPGIDRSNVVIAEAVLAGKAETGRNVVVVGGGTTGCETAHLLKVKGKNVTIVEMLDAIMKAMMPSAVGGSLQEILNKSGVKIMTSTKVEEITDKGLIVTRGGKKETIEADTVVISAGRCSQAELATLLKGIASEIYTIGDAAKPGLITNAIESAHKLALSI